ncbi:uncharacterized protein [Paramormyrops kingsleyae]|uniref:uncharacterized protein n=1 Tax=Paramormyrops kingsleyae TaxID=1676925 RepID=UPI003B974890
MVQVAFNRHFLLSPVCQKTQPNLSVHLTRVCMKTSSKEAICDVLEKAKKDALDVLHWGRVFSYSHIRQIFNGPDPANRMIEELQRRHMVVTGMPQSPAMDRTSTVYTANQPPESSEGEQTEDAHSASSGETFQVTQKVQWPQKTRQLMAEKGLYRKHSLDHPLLKGFATYLERDLQNENFKQEVENVARFLCFMNPQEPSLEFVKEREKTRHFFSELTEAKLTKQTQINYIKSLKRFLKYHTIDTDLRSNNERLWRDAKHFIDYLGLLQRSCAKLVGKEIIQRRHAILKEKHPLSPEDCWAVLRAAKKDFLAVLGKVYPEKGSLESTECCLVLYYLEAVVILKHLQRPGVVEHMTVEEWMTRTTDESGYAVIGVKEHKTSAHQVACFALPNEEEMVSLSHWMRLISHFLLEPSKSHSKADFTRVRPQLLACKRSQMNKDDLGGDERFFISTTGRPIYNASNDLNRLHQKYKLDPVTSQTARRVFETATKTMTDSEKSMVADYLTHSTATADRHYRMKLSRNVVVASKLLSKLAGDSSNESAEEGTSRGARAAARDTGSNRQMDVQMALALLLQTHPVTLDAV